MQSFTKNEAGWMLEAIKLTAEYYNTHSRRTSGMEASLAVLRAEQLTVIADKLGRALEAGNKRIEINY